MLLSIFDWIRARKRRQAAPEAQPPPPPLPPAQPAVASAGMDADLLAHPEDPNLNCRMGMMLLQSADAEQALDYFNLALHYDQGYFPACSGKVRALNALGRGGEVKATFLRFLDASPGHVDACLALAEAYYLEGNHEAILQTLEPLAQGKFIDHRVANWLGLVLGREFGEFDRANWFLRCVLEVQPGWFPALVNLGWNLLEQGNYQDGYAFIDRALSISPEDVEARLVRSCMKLKQGEFREGWRDYGSRHASRFANRCPYAFASWSGESLQGMTLLVYGEQGIGDQIMFASCFNELIGLAQRTIIECNPKLLDLFRRSFPGAVIVPAPGKGKHPEWLKAVGKIDFQIAMGELPALYRNSWDQFPDHKGYLLADPEKVRQWKAKLGHLGDKYKLGISWRGGMVSTRKHLRSIPVGQLMPLFDLSISAISLQYDATGPDLQPLRNEFGVEIQHWQEAIDDYDQTAALVCALDGVLSVCTAIVHLTGALGRPLWVLVPAVSEWRYLDKGERMPWYPSARMIRQTKIGEWEETVTAVGKIISLEIAGQCS